MKPIIWNPDPSISPSASVVIDLARPFEDKLVQSVLSLQPDWAATRGVYQAVPSLLVNGTMTTPFFPQAYPDIALLPLALMLAVCVDANYRRLLAITASGQTTVVPAGPRPLLLDAPHGVGATYWGGKLASVPTSSAAGAGSYCPLFEITEALNQTFTESGLLATLHAIADSVAPEDADVAYEALRFAVRKLFRHATAEECVNLLTSYRIAFLTSAISGVEYDAETDTFNVLATNSFAEFMTARGQVIREHVPVFLSELAQAWLLDCCHDGKFKQIGSFNVQWIDPNGAYAQWFAHETRHIVLLVDDQVSVEVTEDAADLTQMDLTDILSEVDIAVNYNNGQNNRLWDPPSVASEVSGCTSLELDGAPIAYAAESGLLSQTAVGHETDALLGFPSLSEKQRSKKYDMKEVKPNITDDLLLTEYTVKIPKCKAASYRNRWQEFAAQARDSWWHDQGEAFMQDLEESGLEPRYSVRGVDYVVIRNAYEFTSLPTLPDLAEREESIRNLWVLTARAGKDLWSNAVSPQLDGRIICIPCAKLSADSQITLSDECYCTFECVSIATASGSTVFNYQGLSALFETEYDHCVSEYIRRAEDYRAIPGLGGGGPGASYWWLLLEIIPLVALIVGVAAGSNQQNSRNEV